MARWFTFATNPESRELSIDIVKSLMVYGGLSEEEAIAALNYAWDKEDFPPEDMDMRMHETSWYYAISLLVGVGKIVIPDRTRIWEYLNSHEPGDYYPRLSRIQLVSLEF